MWLTIAAGRNIENGRIASVGDEVARIGIDGSLSLGQGVKTRLAEHAGEYRVHEGPGGMVLMTRLAPDGRARGRVLMMGEIISRMTVVEVINVVTSTNWRGELHIVGPLGRRILTVDQGALKHAQTDFETERLGEVLVRAGLIPRADLVPLLAQKSPEQRFGQLLVSKRILDPGPCSSSSKIRPRPSSMRRCSRSVAPIGSWLRPRMHPRRPPPCTCRFRAY
jgi:hypothetical protein